MTETERPRKGEPHTAFEIERSEDGPRIKLCRMEHSFTLEEMRRYASFLQTMVDKIESAPQDSRPPEPAGDKYLVWLDERIRSIGASSWGDESNKQGVLSGFLAARETYVHLWSRHA